MQIARIFATDIDFHPDLRKGDRFSVVYEMIYDSGELVAPGRILAAEFVNDGRAYQRRPVPRRRGQRRLLRARRAPTAQGVPALAAGILARELGLRRALPSDLQELARAHRRRLRRAHGHARARRRRRHVIARRRARRLRQRGRDHATAAASPRSTAHLSGFAPGMRAGARVRQGDPIGYVGRDRLGHRPAPALRVQDRGHPPGPDARRAARRPNRCPRA